ncbi:hypothetical protein CVD28_00155 [Bacillus sp. M6-12]|uniref:hypothetical protein n=1 Tax=Bacillus sp. M6-12 TaxID=2054166 RepID=UPI000C76818B|nr:hypothetical protein [Bacillus sp. M6-12]PLS18848.1 hypothetical protein CVD28_00155 [Bacillus sp. M6-12]
MNKFDELAKECQTLTFEEGWKRIWTEVFSLEKILVAVKKPVEEQDQKEPLLFIGTMNETPCVFAFSDKEHFELFEKRVIEEGDERELAFHEVNVEEFLNFSQHVAMNNISTIMMNFGTEFAFHTSTREIVPMYNAFVKGDFLQEQRVQEGTMIQVAVPEEINQIKQAIEQVKGNYRNVLNHISPVLVKLGNRVDLTFVMGFKGGLPVAIKKSVMQNIHKELAVSPLFQTQIYFTEEQNIVPPQITNVVRVNF